MTSQPTTLFCCLLHANQRSIGYEPAYCACSPARHRAHQYKRHRPGWHANMCCWVRTRARTSHTQTHTRMPQLATRTPELASADDKYSELHK